MKSHLEGVLQKCITKTPDAVKKLTHDVYSSIEFIDINCKRNSMSFQNDCTSVTTAVVAAMEL